MQKHVQIVTWVKTHSNVPQKVLDVQFCHEKLEIYLFIDI